MPEKVDNINDLKAKKNGPTGLEVVEEAEEVIDVDSTDEIVEDIEKSAEQRLAELEHMMSDERRREIVTKVDQFLMKEDIDVYEAMLAFTDLFGSLFNSILTREKSEDENKVTIDRINSVRQKIVDSLNERESGQSLAEDTVALLSLVSEGVIVGLKQDMELAKKQASKE